MVLYKMKKSVKAINISGLGEYAFFPSFLCGQFCILSLDIIMLITVSD